MDLGIKGKRALVLASSRGLGLGIAKALAAEGANVLLCGRDEERLASNCSEINALDQGTASFVKADLADPDFVPTLVAAVQRQFGGLDILVNNSGGPTPGGTQDMSADKLATYFQSMIVPIIDLTNALLPGMREQGWGRILTVASSGVIEPIGGLALSNTLRPALVGWSKTLSTEVAKDGVTSNILLPGSIYTDRIDDLTKAAAIRTGRSQAEVQASAQSQIPAGRYGRVEEFAATAAFLCSAPASYITGSMVRCDGGANRSV